MSQIPKDVCNQVILDYTSRLGDARKKVISSGQNITATPDMRQKLLGSPTSLEADVFSFLSNSFIYIFGHFFYFFFEMADIDGRSKMRSATKDLSRGTDILDQTILVATDTEHTATGTMEELSRHRDVLHSIDGHVFLSPSF
jgi:hypothetical protein